MLRFFIFFYIYEQSKFSLSGICIHFFLNVFLSLIMFSNFLPLLLKNLMKLSLATLNQTVSKYPTQIVTYASCVLLCFVSVIIVFCNIQKYTIKFTFVASKLVLDWRVNHFMFLRSQLECTWYFAISVIIILMRKVRCHTVVNCSFYYLCIKPFATPSKVKNNNTSYLFPVYFLILPCAIYIICATNSTCFRFSNKKSNHSTMQRDRSRRSSVAATSVLHDDDISGEIKIQASDMAVDMQRVALNSAAQAIRIYSTEKHIAESIKQDFDQMYNPTWHCIVGRNWGSCVTHSKQCYIRLSYKDMTIMLYRST